MDYVVFGMSILTCVIAIIVLIIVIKNKKTGDITLGDEDTKKIKDSVSESVNTLSTSISNLVAEKNSTLMNDLSTKVDSLNAKIDDLVKSQNDLADKQKDFEKKLSDLLNDNHNKTTEQINSFQKQYFEDHKKQQDEITDKLSEEIQKFNKTVKETLDEFKTSTSDKLKEFKDDTKDSFRDLSNTVNTKLEEIRKDNNEKLEQINTSVNEKLQKTLEDKLKDSFNGVIAGISDVNKAVGEIKGIATDVGSLKSVLTNVKTKGIMGEVILGNIIKEFLTCGQYEENIATKKGSSERVEFAIVLPGTKDSHIYLPVDSKFPYEPYSKLHESTDSSEIENARKALKNNLLKYAKDVHDKYIDVPNTTEFAVIFLPLEGLYLEVLNMGLFEEIQTKYRVTLTGPTTFTAFINSLNMGFRSLLIQKKSADVFNLLGAVKTEFGKFAEALEKTQKKVNAASDELDTLVGTRTRALNKKLKDVDALDEETTKLLLGDASVIEAKDENE